MKRGSFIIRQLCALLTSEKIVRSIGGACISQVHKYIHMPQCDVRADILMNEEDVDFAALLVQHLNIILMTAPELMDSRKRLKDMATPESRQLFTVLYRCDALMPIHEVGQ